MVGKLLKRESMKKEEKSAMQFDTKSPLVALHWIVTFILGLAVEGEIILALVRWLVSH